MAYRNGNSIRSQNPHVPSCVVVGGTEDPRAYFPQTPLRDIFCPPLTCPRTSLQACLCQSFWNLMFTLDSLTGGREEKPFIVHSTNIYQTPIRNILETGFTKPLPSWNFYSHEGTHISCKKNIMWDGNNIQYMQINKAEKVGRRGGNGWSGKAALWRWDLNRPQGDKGIATLKLREDCSRNWNSK